MVVSSISPLPDLNYLDDKGRDLIQTGDNMKTKLRGLKILALKIKVMCPEAKESFQPPNSEGVKRQIVPYSPQKECGTANTLISVQQN